MTTITLSTTLSSRPVIGNGGGGGIPPANTIAPVISGTGVVGQTLSCSTGTWTGIPAPTYTYQWLRGVSDIPGATSSTYTLVQADATFVITCQVTATNTAGSASVTSSNSLVIDDADAQAFITAANITNTTQQNAINTLVVDLKGYGVWSKMKAIYPFVGGTASTHKWNLKDPRDLDAAFRLVFNGGWTHSATGATPNGINAFGNTFLSPFANMLNTSAHSSFYLRTPMNVNPMGYGCVNSAFTTRMDIRIATGNNLFSAIGGSSSQVSTTATPFQSLILGSRINNISNKIYVGGILRNTNTVSDSSNLPSFNYYLGAINESNLTKAFTDDELAFSSIGDGLTDTEASNLYTAVQAYQVALGRSVGPQTVSDPDAQAFVTAADIQDQVQAQAINTLTIDLKNYGVWTKMKAVYPFVGGTATSHSYNLVNPTQYQITWFGGVTHSSNGIAGNGTNGYGDTFLNNDIMAQNSVAISIYARNILSQNSCDLGSWNSGFGSALYSTRADNSFLGTVNRTLLSGVGVPSVLNGFSLVKRESSTQLVFQRNTTQTTIAATSNIYINTSFKLLRIGNSNSEYSGRNLAFSTIGDGLTNTEAANLYLAVQNYQTTLNRQV